MNIEQWLEMSIASKKDHLRILLEELETISNKTHELHGTKRQGKLAQYKTTLESEIRSLISWANEVE